MSVRTPLTLVVLLMALVVGAVVGWQLATTNVPSLSSASGSGPTCRDKSLGSGSELRAGQVTVNVHNAGQVSGLAGETLAALTGKGFRGGVADDAGKKVTADNVLILSAAPKSVEVRLVASQFKGKVDVRSAPGKGSDAVDVYVGNHFRGLDDKARTSLRVGHKMTVCVPVGP
ncbi:MAG: LytR C-terminal domain-containing protein [Nocardioidaceae bacterium]